MNVDEVLQNNPNPANAVKVLRAHPRLLQELNFHTTELATKITNASTDDEAAEHLREFLISSTVNSTMSRLNAQSQERQMRDRVLKNPKDDEASKFIQDLDARHVVDSQYQTVMSEYPETMVSVLMLYIDCKINNTHVQAFVDSGAQTSVMTLACAKKCGIDNLIDARFSATLVGVGSTKSLGKIHMAPIQIGNSYFPMSITVMDNSGDKNMEFLFGLDMLKRHKCNIDLEHGLLRFHGHSGASSTPFLHEKDLGSNKGGTKLVSGDLSAPDDVQIKTEPSSPVPASATSAPPAGPPPLPSATQPGCLDMAEKQRRVAILIERGFPKPAAERILPQCDWDVETAITCLMFEQ